MQVIKVLKFNAFKRKIKDSVNNQHMDRKHKNMLIGKLHSCIYQSHLGDATKATWRDGETALEWSDVLVPQLRMPQPISMQ